jgi:hypothetical protein
MQICNFPVIPKCFPGIPVFSHLMGKTGKDLGTMAQQATISGKSKEKRERS